MSISPQVIQTEEMDPNEVDLINELGTQVYYFSRLQQIHDELRNLLDEFQMMPLSDDIANLITELITMLKAEEAENVRKANRD